VYHALQVVKIVLKHNALNVTMDIVYLKSKTEHLNVLIHVLKEHDMTINHSHVLNAEKTVKFVIQLLIYKMEHGN